MMTDSHHREQEAAVQKFAIFLGFVPWIVFSVVAGPSTWMWAALAALACSLILAVPDLRTSRSISILDAAALVFFAVLVVLALVLDRAALQPIEDRAQLLSSIVIAVVALGSLAVGRQFTEFYARKQTPQEYWDSPRFKQINRVLTGLWGAVFVLNALCGAAVGYWAPTRASPCSCPTSSRSRATAWCTGCGCRRGRPGTPTASSTPRCS